MLVSEGRSVSEFVLGQRSDSLAQIYIRHPMASEEACEVVFWIVWMFVESFAKASR